MKTRRLDKSEGPLGYCHDCHNRAHIEVTFAHRQPIRLCDRCAGILIKEISSVKKNGNGKKISIK
jgi:ribosomal protein S27E